MTTEMDTHACVYKDSEINKCNSFYMAKMGALPTMPLRCRTNQPDYKNGKAKLFLNAQAGGPSL
uniref:Uncharacterized protein n=1 Tax=Arundo donax TaxID=35708 RepID=A0A0A9EAS1_ARUDO